VATLPLRGFLPCGASTNEGRIYLQCPDPHAPAIAIAIPIPTNFAAVFVRRQNVPPFNSVLYASR
jgi:hypothetical protein